MADGENMLPHNSTDRRLKNDKLRKTVPSCSLLLLSEEAQLQKGAMIGVKATVWKNT